MSCCTSIIIEDGVDGVPTQYKLNGKCFLDLPDNFAFVQSKSALALNDLNNFEVATALGFSVLDTAKNKAILDPFINPLSMLAGTRAKVTVISAGCVSEFTRLCVTQHSDGTYEIEVDNDPETNWFKCLETLKLNTLDLGEFVYTKANLETNWANDAAYQDGGNCYYFPMVNYGSWLGDADTGVLVEDFRPFFHLTGLLDKALCECGVKFRSPFFETEFGRRLITYLLDANYSTSEALLDSRAFHATGEHTLTGTGTSVTTHNVVFPLEQFDTGNNYDNTTGEYLASVIADFQFQIYMSFPATDFNQIDISLVKKTAAGNEILWSQNIPASDTIFGFAGIQAQNIKDVTLINGESICLQISTFIPSFTVTGYFKNTPLKAFYSEGDTLPLAQLIDPEKCALDLLKGAAHLIDGRIHFDALTNELWLYTPNATTVYDEDVEGYFLNEYINISDKVVCKSGGMSNNKNDIARYCLIRFQKSDDSYVEEIAERTGSEERLYSRLIDRGEGFKEETEEKENPCFQPTANAFTPVPNDAAAGDTFAFDMPQLLDNAEGNSSFDLGFRILYAKGLVRQEIEAGNAMEWLFEGGVENQMPYAFQVPNATTANGRCEERLIYGTHPNDLYNLAWQDRAARQVFVNQNFDVLFSCADYKKINFRNKLIIYDGNKTYSGRAIEISDADFCARRARVVIDSNAILNDLCLEEVEVNECDNRVGIDCTSTDEEVSATIDNSNINSPVANQTFEFSVDGGNTWQNYGGQTISGENEVRFRVVTTYEDGCLNTTNSKIWRKNCKNESELDCAFDSDTFTLVVTAMDNFNSSIDTSSITASIDSLPPIAYTFGTPINLDGGETLEFVYTITFSDGCPPLEVRKTFEVPNKPTCQNFPTAEIIKIADCTYTVEMDYTNTVREVQQELIQLKINGRYINWDRQPFVAVQGFEEIRILIYYCDCPKSCITFLKEDLPV